MAFWICLGVAVIGGVITNRATTPQGGNDGMALTATGGFMAFVFGLVWLFGG